MQPENEPPSPATKQRWREHDRVAAAAPPPTPRRLPDHVGPMFWLLRPLSFPAL